MRFKRGMTLAETLLVFVIIGIIASVTIISVKPWEKSYKHIYSRIYNALSVTIFNDMVDTGKFPENSTEFCKTLLKYMNTANNLDADEYCGPFNDVGSKPNFAPTWYPYKDASGNHDGNAIHLSNSSYIWYGGNTNDTSCSGNCPFVYGSDDNIVKFYLVFADLNGDRKPNVANYLSSKQRSDIVAFAVTDKFAVVPLGYPVIDMKYLQAHYISPSENDDEDDIVSDPMAFRAAQILAFGTGTPDEDSCPDSDITDCETIESITDPMTLELQNTYSLDWVTDSWTKSEETPYHPCKDNRPFCVNWNSNTAKDAILRVVTDAEGNKNQIKAKDLRIHESCKSENAFTGYTEPVCSVKIYDYH